MSLDDMKAVSRAGAGLLKFVDKVNSTTTYTTAKYMCSM